MFIFRGRTPAVASAFGWSIWIGCGLAYVGLIIFGTTRKR